MEAEKLKKKLNGSILKGSKVRVDEARPKKRTTPDSDAAGNQPEKAQKRKKRKTDQEGTIPGVELTDRKVQRGWTGEPSQGKTPKDKKSKSTTSAYGSKPECLFRTKVPPNASSAQSTSTESSVKSKKGKSEKAQREAVVHEFSNTTKHGTFLRDSQVTNGSKVVSQYVDGKGWLDEHGNLVEATTSNAHKPTHENAKSEPPKEIKSLNATSEFLYTTFRKRKAEHKTVAPQEEDTSSSGSSSESELSSSSSDSESDVESALEAANAEPAIPTKKPSKPTAKSSTTKALTNGHGSSLDTTSHAPKSQTPPPSACPVSKEPHPLETMFKRPETKPIPSNPRPNLQVQTTFNFFSPDDGDEKADTTHNVPQTPFTQRDFQQRGQRSAAPTPDTAAPGRRAPSGWTKKASEDEAEPSEPSELSPALRKSAMRKNGKDEQAETGKSSFKEWFWEHRGDTNRAWKKRRREMAKEKRQRENKRHSGRGV